MLTEITIQDKTFEAYITKEEIAVLVNKLAKQISTQYKGKNLVVIGVLNGSFMFLSDLVKQISEDVNITVTFIKVASYNGATSSSGEVKNILGLDKEIAGENVLVVEDILDTLTTINNVCATLAKHNPKTLQVVSLLSKQAHVNAIYGKLIQDYFVVGYGMDYKGQGRNYKDIYKLKQ